MRARIPNSKFLVLNFVTLLKAVPNGRCAMPLTRRRFLRNMSMSGAAIRVGLPPLAAMFNMNGTAYAAAPRASAAIQPRFVFWFNGNGIPERYWIPRELGRGYELTPCLAPLESLRADVHVVSGID